MRKIKFSYILAFIVTATSITIPAKFVQADEVPLYIKYRFEKQTRRKWIDASPERREKFLATIREQNRREKMVKESRMRRIEQKKTAKRSADAVEAAKAQVRAQRKAIREMQKRQKLEMRKRKAALSKKRMLEKIRQAREKSQRARRR